VACPPMPFGIGWHWWLACHAEASSEGGSTSAFLPGCEPRTGGRAASATHCLSSSRKTQGRACARQARPHSLTASLQTTSVTRLGFGLGCRRRRRFRSRRGGRFLSRRGGRFLSRRGGRFLSRRGGRFRSRRGRRFSSRRRSRRRHRLALATADDHHGHQQTHTQTSQPPLTHSHRRTLHRGS